MNLNPKDKAIELTRKFYDEMGDSDDFFDESLPKKCALIAVDEILNTSASEYQHEFNFWQEVKQEIEKL